MKKLNKIIEFNLVQFPIIFPLIYLYLLTYFPSYENWLIYITIFLLAESHFAATWPFFLDRVNTNYILKKKIPLVIVPIIIFVTSLIGFFFIKKFFILIFYALNIYHVMRQSIGICKLYSNNQSEVKLYEKIIYFFNIIFFIVGFIRFYNLNLVTDLIVLNISVVSFIIMSMIFLIFKFGFSKKILTCLTGIVIFYPVCFVQNPIHVILMGVTMHYTQYLYLTYKVTRGRADNEVGQQKSYNSRKIFIFFSFIFLYSFTMTFLTSMGKSGDIIIKQLILIPMIGQIIHFYIDSQLWKFSEQHNRENVLKHII